MYYLLVKPPRSFVSLSRCFPPCTSTFQKKSKRDIASAKEDMDIIHARLKIAEAFAKELRKSKLDLLMALKCIVIPATCLPTLTFPMLKSSRSKLVW